MEGFAQTKLSSGQLETGSFLPIMIPVPKALEDYEGLADRLLLQFAQGEVVNINERA